MSKISNQVSAIHWLISRVAVIYAILFVFCLLCVDFKTVDMRIKLKHLNGAIPDFSNMINSAKYQNQGQAMDWSPYKNYFELILRYMPDDFIAKQLLGFVDYHTGQEQEAIELLKSSAVVNGQELFWPNYNLGVLYYKKNMWPQAAEYLLKTVASNPQVMVFLMQNSFIYKQIFANPYFRYSLNDEIKDAQSRAYILLLSSLYHMGQYDKVAVISDLGIANQNLSYKDAFYYYAGLAFFDTGQISKAFLLFQKSLTVEKNNPDVYYYMASIYQKEGQLEQARDFLRVSYALHQKNDPRFPYEAKINPRFF